MTLRPKPLLSSAVLLILLVLLVAPGIIIGWSFYPAAWRRIIVGPRSRPLRCKRCREKHGGGDSN
jgi:hypothetical protein